MKNKGFSLLETMMAATVLGLVVAGSAGLTVNVIKSFYWTSTQLDADLSAGMAVQRISRDLQAAKQITLNTPTCVVVSYPVKNADGTYTRTALDTTNTIQYYRGLSNGNESATGAYLWRKPAGQSGKAICEDLTYLEFESSNPASLDITVKTSRKKGSATTKSDMVHRAIFLRNY